MTSTLDLSLDPVALTAALVDIPSVSGAEGPLADAVETALRQLPALRVERYDDCVVARTALGRSTRLLLAGHLDTVPIASNVPSRATPGVLHGCGSTDMKSGIAVMLHLAATLAAGTGDSLREDLTLVCYDNEEVEASRNGLGRLARTHPALLAADLAVLLEPTAGLVEAGCQGTLRVRLTAAGRRAHSARSWLGVNAIHRLAPVLAVLADYQPRTVAIDGCTYSEGLSAVGVSGGVAGNVVPDEAVVVVNFRFAPDRGEDQALAHVESLFAGLPGVDLEATDSAPGALPRLSEPATVAFVDAVRAATGEEPRAKYGWTDVARFAALGIPAVNFGPGEPDLAHTREEYVETARIGACAGVLAAVLTGS